MNTLRAIALTAILSIPSSSAHAEVPLRARYADGFFLETSEGDFQLKLGGNLHLDTRLYHASERGAPHTIDLRRARIDLQGRLFDWLTFRLQPEFVGTPYIRNAWVDFGMIDALHLQVGQLKVPFSSAWLTRDNNVNFVERASSSPVYPFFDRGMLLWGDPAEGTVLYNVGLFTGAGISADGKSDLDDSKDLAGRLFLQPFRNLASEVVRGIVLVGEATWGEMSVPTSRYETGGLRSPNFATPIWRWRTEQTIGTDGRVTDRVTATVASRMRWGAEAHYLLGPWALSAEYLEVRYDDIATAHVLDVGSTTAVHQSSLERDGAVRSLSVWSSYYLTGESKTLANGGWKQAKPRRPIGSGGVGAIEALVRYSRTWTSPELFYNTRVDGFAPGTPDLGSYGGATPGAGNRVTLAVLQGAHDVHEWTIGLSWALTSAVRIQLNDVVLWAPAEDRDGDGANDNLLLSGALSSQADSAKRGTPVSWENAFMSRLIFKL